MITVSQIKELAPEADIIRLDPKARYLIIVSGEMQAAFELGEQLNELGIKCVLIDGDELRSTKIYELHESVSAPKTREEISALAHELAEGIFENGVMTIPVENMKLKGMTQHEIATLLWKGLP